MNTQEKTSNTSDTALQLTRALRAIFGPIPAIRLSNIFYLYHIKCPHREFITPTIDTWCTECNTAIIGKPICTVHANWREDGTVIVHGEGEHNAPK